MKLKDIKVGMKVEHVSCGKGVIVCDIPDEDGQFLVKYLEGELQDESWGAFPENLKEVKEETMQDQKKPRIQPHVHAEVIKAWADGAKIEYFSNNKNCWCNTECPLWTETTEYRVKPEPKPDNIYFSNVYASIVGSGFNTIEEAKKSSNGTTAGVIKIVIDGETKKLKSVEIVE